MKNIIIILNYNDSNNCLKLYNQIKDYKCLDGIIFVDNNSKETSYKDLKSINDKKVDVIRLNSNEGYAHGNNEGIKYVIKKYKECNLIISNPDIEISEANLKGLLNQISSNKDISLLGPTIIECKTISRGWKLTDGWDEVKLSIPVYGSNRNKVVGYKDNYYKGDITKVDVVSGSFFIIKSNVIKDINYFDERTFLYYEENILSTKLKVKKYNVYVSNKYKVKHNHSESVDKNINNIKKFKILKESQNYYVNNYCNANGLQKLLIKIFSDITLLGIKMRRR